MTNNPVPAAEASDERPDESVVASTEHVDDGAMTPRQLAEAKQYGRLELYCGLIDRIVDVTYLALFAWLAARPLDQWLQGFSLLHSGSIRLAVFYLLMTLAHVCVSFPLSFYSGHVLEHRFGMSRQTFGRWLWRYLKRNLLALLFGMLIVEGLFWTIWLTGPLWWLVAAGVFFVVSIIIGQLAPVLILPLFYKIRSLDDVELNDRLARLAEGTGLSLQGVYRMEMSSETVKANAMLAGLGRTRRVILGDTLLDQFSPEEIEVIFAHEIGHHVHHHIGKLVLVMLVLSTASFFLCDQLLRGFAGVGGAIGYARLPVSALPLLMLVITLTSLILEPLQNAISRHFERQSDRYALHRTRAPSAYSSAFRKLAKLNKADPQPHPLEVFLFHSHPPISERLAYADASVGASHPE